MTPGGRRRRLALGVMALVTVILCGAARAETPTIPLPADLQVTPPAADVAPHAARFLGAWSGAWDGVLPHVLVVEGVEASGRAHVVYALGESPEANVTRGYRRVTARVVGDMLTVDVSDRATVVYHIDGDALRGRTRPRGVD